MDNAEFVARVMNATTTLFAEAARVCLARAIEAGKLTEEAAEEIFVGIGVELEAAFDEVRGGVSRPQ